jgi:polyketide synthase PksL
MKSADKKESPTSYNEDIAIIGLSLKFPQSQTLEEFWGHLAAERSLITEVSPERWDKNEYFGDPRRGGNKTNSIWGGFIDYADCFDADFFNISPREAETMDPQQRMALELSWKAIEDAGYKASSLAGSKTGVFMGVCHWDYAELLEKHVEDVDAYFPTGVAYAIIANRISYFFDFTGPSITNDTACASSLVSIYEAVRALHNNECEYALAGGVNLCWSPKHFVAFSKNGMLSKDGKCKAFDDGANGYVRGEGGAVLLLKPLRKAEEDNDPIYAVIKGVGTNHGGRTSSLTVTNQKAQASLIADIYEKAAVSPETVSYIEAHGPGTPVGDPIEVHGLKNAFNQLYEKFGKKPQASTCGLGSVKTNIGHLEGAAGIAGVVKVVASMKHKMLPATVNFNKLNSIINFKDSPFYVVDKTQAWEVANFATDTDSRPVRRAGVSSFGFGGSNAHILLEEYIPVQQQEIISSETSDSELVAIPLSAKNADRLQAYTLDFLNFLKQVDASSAPDSATNFSLKALAYTLQVGREAMDERVIFLVNNVQNLIQKVEAFTQGEKEIGQCWQANVQKNKNKVGFLSNDDDLQELIYKWLSKGRVEKVAELWVQGVSIDWSFLYGDAKPQKLRLPTYSFAKEKHWYRATENSYTSEFDSVSKLHPLLHSNTSTLQKQRFSSVFTGKEFFLADHIIQGRVILPGVAYLEMTRAAIAAALNEPLAQTSIQLQNVVWIRPIAINIQPVQVHIGVVPEENGQLAFEIYTESESNPPELVLHSKGYAMLRPVATLEPLNLTELRSTCDEISLSPAQCYKAFRTMAMEHGSRLQGLQEVYAGSDQVLAKITLPGSVADTANRFVLHPSMMDSALQASVVLLTGIEVISIANSQTVLNPALPFALENLEILAPCTTAMWAWVRYAQGSKPSGAVRKLIIDLCDETGRICVRMKGFSSRVSEGQISLADTTFHQQIRKAETVGEVQTTLDASTTVDLPRQNGLVYSTSYWKESTLPTRQRNTATSSETLVLLAGLENSIAQSLKATIDAQVKILFEADAHESAIVIQKAFGEAFTYVQSILQSKPRNKQQVLLLIPEGPGNYIYASVAALLKTAKLENPKIAGKTVLVPTNIASHTQSLSDILENERNAGGEEIEIRYTHEGRREVKSIAVLKLGKDEEKTSLIKSGGVYWITGGLGGLGKIFTEYLGRAEGVTIILNGRSELTEDKQAELVRLQQQGLKVDYIQADLSYQADVQRVVRVILDTHGALHGIFHCAGVVKDSFILKKTQEEISDVFAPKVNGLFCIEEATQNLNLDFVILFSSIAAQGNIGQADYAGANAVLDAFAAYRQSLVNAGRRSGKTIAINWPLWQSGGMTVDQGTIEQMRKNTGMTPLPTIEGLQAFEHILTSTSYTQVGVAYGDKAKIEASLHGTKLDHTYVDKKPMEAANTVNSEVSAKELKNKTTDFLKGILGKAIRVEPSKIQEDQKLSEYGLDSIVIIDVTSQLEDLFGSLSKTLFFEYVDVQGVAQYFIEEHKEKLIEVLGLAKPTPVNMQENRPVVVVEEAVSAADNARSRFVKQSAMRSEEAIPASSVYQDETASYHDIAIIGVSGKYPQAETLEDFWQNLLQGKHCFQKIPTDRWKHEEIYFNERDILGKSTIKTGAFINDIDKFDPRYFSISQIQAELMSPEVRLFLQVGVEALEDAGYSKEYIQKKYNGDVGVLVGTMSNHYGLYGFQNMLTRGSLANGSYTGTIPNMLSYFYGFTGPSLFLDTMCSGSSTCIHQAVQMLRSKECKMVVAGGISLLLHPYHLISSSQEHYTTKTAEMIRSYGLGADGTILGEGVGAIVLKPLVEAQKDGDHIYGVIKGTAITNAGVRNGFTVPNPHMQALAIEKAIEDAKIDPRTISYVEGHGSGTALGDPIEIKGLTLAYKKYTQDLQFCSIGSVKSNIAHLLGAAGLAGLTKVLLQFKHKKIVPSLHADELNPSIQFKETPFYVHRELSDWKQPTVVVNGQEKTVPRRAGITSIGAGGMNSHIIVEEYIEADVQASFANQSDDQPYLMVFSAMNKKGLLAYLQRFKSYISYSANLDLASVAYTLQVGKNELPCRLAMLVSGKQDLLQTIDTFSEASAKGNSLKDQANVYFVSTLLERQPEFDAEDKDIEQHIQTKHLAKIAEYWVNGVKIDWDNLYTSAQPKRTSLPAYPFEKISCWYQVYKDAPSVLKPLSSRAKLHPFIGKNESDLAGLKYATTLYLDEVLDYVYIVDQQQQILPTFAIDTALALGNIAGVKGEIGLKNIRWNQSVDWKTVNQLHTSVATQGKDSLKVYLAAEDADARRANLYQAMIVPSYSLDLYKEADQFINLSQIKEKARNVVNSTQFYAALASVGLEYKPFLEGITEVYVGRTDSLLVGIQEPVFRQDHHKQHVYFSPEVLGAIMQGVQYWAKEQQVKEWAQLVPQVVKEVLVWEKGADSSYILFDLKQTGKQVVSNIRLTDRHGKVVSVFADVVFMQAMDFPEKEVRDASKSVTVSSPIQESNIQEKLFYTLREHVSTILKFNVEEVDENTHFYSYGFDSIALAKLANQINKELKTSISPALFFQCENIKELGEYILSHHFSNCQSFYQNQAKSEPIVAPITTDVIANDTNKLEEQLLYSLRQYVSQIVKFSMEEIDVHTHFYSYGFESIALNKLTSEINKDFQIQLSPAIFFQCENIKELADFILATYSSQLESVWRSCLENSPGKQPSTKHQQQETAYVSEVYNSTFVHEYPKELLDNGNKVNQQMPIAIIGAAGRFPQSDDLAEYWSNLVNGKDLIADFPFDRYDEFYQKAIQQAVFPKKAGVINDVDKFDAEFFNISPLEAELMDPQHRLTLETIWKAIEDCGYTPKQLPSNTGLFFGVSGTDYANLLTAYQVPIDAFTATGTSHAMLANRVSFLLDIHGPSEPVDTACSSSLVSIHRAIESIKSGACEMAIAGGVNLILSTDTFVGPNLAGMLSPDGACKTFSKEANGYVRGEGVGAIVLKPLAQAEKDNDPILGVIIGSAVNHGGRASSLTAPNAKSQAQLIEQAMKGIDPTTISYIETHGTGTSLGDPVEINGLKLAFQNLMHLYPQGSKKEAFCGLGAVKTNVGHLEAAAGIAGVMKVLLSMKHKVLPATLHCQQINPYIELTGSPFYIVQEKQAWKEQYDERGNRVPRRAGISSFGFGGANAHIVLEEYHKVSQRSGSPTLTTRTLPELIVLSAKNEERLKKVAQNLCTYLQTVDDTAKHNLSLTNIAYTLQVGREAMEERLAIVAESIAGLIEKLKAFSENRTDMNGLYQGSVKRNKGSLSVFTADEAMAAKMEGWMANKQYTQLAELWVKGWLIPWEKLYVMDKPERLSLPTYPFAKSRYWIPVTDAPKAVNGLPEAEQPSFDETFYNHLIDGLVDNTLSVEDAIQLAKSLSL